MALQGIDILNSGVVRNVQVSTEGGAVISPGLIDTTGTSSTVNAPGVGGNIVIIPAGNTPKGQYRVTVVYFFSGGTNELLTNNLKLFSQGVQVLTGLPTPATQNVPVTVEIPRVTTDGVNGMALKAVATATAGTIYNAYMQATRIT